MSHGKWQRTRSHWETCFVRAAIPNNQAVRILGYKIHEREPEPMENTGSVSTCKWGYCLCIHSNRLEPGKAASRSLTYAGTRVWYCLPESGVHLVLFHPLASWVGLFRAEDLPSRHQQHTCVMLWIGTRLYCDTTPR